MIAIGNAAAVLNHMKPQQMNWIHFFFILMHFDYVVYFLHETVAKHQKCCSSPEEYRKDAKFS